MRRRHLHGTRVRMWQTTVTLLETIAATTSATLRIAGMPMPCILALAGKFPARLAVPAKEAKDVQRLHRLPRMRRRHLQGTRVRMWQTTVTLLETIAATTSATLRIAGMPMPCMLALAGKFPARLAVPAKEAKDVQRLHRLPRMRRRHLQGTRV